MAKAVVVIVACCALLVGSFQVPHFEDSSAMLQVQVTVEAGKAEVSSMRPPVLSVAVFVVFLVSGVIAAMACMFNGLRSQQTEQGTVTERRGGHESSFEVDVQSSTADKEETKLFDTSGMSLIVNIVADIAPVGFLPVASGIKYIGFIPSFTAMFVLMYVCVYTMWMTSRNCEITGSLQLDRQWAMVIGPRTAWVPVMASAIACFGDNVAFACFFADMFEDAFSTVGISMSRTQCCIMFSVFPTLPLCLLKELSALAPSSAMGVLAIIFTLMAMVHRAMDGSYEIGGLYYKDLFVHHREIPIVPHNHHLYAFTFISFLKLLNTLSLSFMTHYNACTYYHELKLATPERFANLTFIALAICASIYSVSMIAGYATFGYNAEEMILSNYAPEDVLLNVARFGAGIALLVAYPVTFSGLRRNAVTMLEMLRPSNKLLFASTLVQDLLTVLFVSLVTIVAVFLVDDGLMVGLVGSVCGSSVIFIIPTLLHIFATRNSQGSSFHRCLAMCILAFGIALMIVSTIEIAWPSGSADISARHDKCEIPGHHFHRNVHRGWKHQTHWPHVCEHPHRH